MSDIVIYENGDLELNIEFENETIWLNQKQIVELFEKDQSVISRHINNIFKDNEVDEKSNMQKMHIANSDKPVKFYSLDIVLAVGYRTNSSKAIKFRQWATKILKEYLIDDYVINKDKLQQQKLQELDQTIQLIKQGLQNKELSTTEAKGFVEIISSYAKSWALLQGYDEQSLEEIVQTKEEKFVLDYDEAKEAIAEPKKTLIAIGAYLFVLFLHKNGILYKKNGEPKINDNTLVSVALLVAQSHPDQKEIIIKLVMNMLYEGEV